MSVEYTFDYCHLRYTDPCESIEEAAGRAYADDEHGTAWPIRITADGKTIWERGHWLANDSEKLLKLANYPASPESDSAP